MQTACCNYAITPSETLESMLLGVVFALLAYKLA